LKVTRVEAEGGLFAATPTYQATGPPPKMMRKHLSEPIEQMRKKTGTLMNFKHSITALRTLVMEVGNQLKVHASMALAAFFD